VEVLQNDLTYNAHCSKARHVVPDMRNLGRAADEVAHAAACVVFMTKVGQMAWDGIKVSRPVRNPARLMVSHDWRVTARAPACMRNRLWPDQAQGDQGNGENLGKALIHIGCLWCSIC
jgi:hypothetical protein